MSQEYDAIEASQYLRITPELLYHYVRHGAKGRGGRRLPCGRDSAARRFRKDDLDAYDAWLREPWAEPGSPRKDPPQGVRDYLKVESGGLCPLCKSSGPFEDAHIEDWNLSRSNHHHNLLRLCTACHARFDRKEIPREEIERRKQEAIARVQAHLGRRTEPLWPIPGAPPLAPTFLGREREVQAVTDALRLGRSVAIEGVGGIGKTQLLLNALRSAAEGRPVLWLSVDTIGTHGSLRETLAALARDRGIEVTNGRPRLDEARACLVFDGIERLSDDHDAVADLLDELLAGSFDTLIVATTQVRLARLEFEETVRIGPLGEDFARAILGVAERSAASESLIAFADGHPLTLRLLRVLVRHYGSSEAVETELERRGVAAVADPQRARQSASSSLTVCLELAYSRLDTGEKRLLWMVAMSPGGLRPALLEMAGSVGPDDAAAEAGLRAWNLVDLYSDPEFADLPPFTMLAVLSPVRAFVLAAARTDGSIDRDEVALSFCKGQACLSELIQYRMLRKDAVFLGRALMKRELPNMLSAFDLAAGRVDREGFATVVISLAHSTMMTLFTCGAFSTGADVMRRAAALAAAHGSLVDAMQFLVQMQTLAERQFDRALAAAALAEGERLASDAEGEAKALLLLMRASAAERANRYDEAARLARESYDLFQSTGNCEEERRKTAGFTLARALEFSGRPAEALPYFEDALQCAESNDPINRGSLLHHIGNCEAYAGRYQAAMHAYRKAAEQFAELEAVEFISNALGEAGLIVPHLDPPIGLPGKATVEAALDDVVDQLAVVASAEMYGGRNPRVTIRKLIGITCLALHNRQEELLARKADEMYDRLVRPLVGAPEPPDWLKIILFHIQWIIRLFQYLALLSDQRADQRLKPAEVTVLAWLVARAFVSLGEVVAEPLASYLRRRRGMVEIDAADILAAIESEGDGEVYRALRQRAEADEVDLGWLF